MISDTTFIFTEEISNNGDDDSDFHIQDSLEDEDYNEDYFN